MKGIVIRRAFSTAIDLIVVSPLVAAGLIVASVFDLDYGWVDAPILLFAISGYFALSHSKYGRSIGERVAGILLTADSGKRVTADVAFLRVAMVLLGPYLIATITQVLVGLGVLSNSLALPLIEGATYVVLASLVLPVLATGGRFGFHDLLAGSQMVRAGYTAAAPKHRYLTLSATILASVGIGIFVGEMFVGLISATPREIGLTKPDDSIKVMPKIDQSRRSSSDGSDWLARSLKRRLGERECKQLNEELDSAPMIFELTAGIERGGKEERLFALDLLRHQLSGLALESNVAANARNVGLLTLRNSWSVGPATISTDHRYAVVFGRSQAGSHVKICEADDQVKYGFHFHDLPLGQIG